MTSELDENTIKVLARFTEIGQHWPMGAWVYMRYIVMNDDWYLVTEGNINRIANHISELEANQKGLFRDKTKTKSYSISKKDGTLRNLDGSRDE